MAQKWLNHADRWVVRRLKIDTFAVKFPIAVAGRVEARAGG